MPLPPAAQQVVDARRAAIDAAVARYNDAPWPKRAQVVGSQLDAIHGDWWAFHHGNPGFYAQDLARLNQLAGWTGKYAQVTEVVRNGHTYFAPPKFFGGDAVALHEDFVLSISLNHATPETDDYLDELADLQAQDTCLKAHRDYFRQGYVYKPFFAARFKVLKSYSEKRGLEAPADWKAANERFSVYLERYPTLSESCMPATAPHEDLIAKTFVMALNELAHRVVLGLLRPRAVLLAGQATWQLLPEATPIQVGQIIRPNQQRRCRATLDHVALTHGARLTAVLRCNFLRTVFGPNSDQELEQVGRLLAE